MSVAFQVPLNWSHVKKALGTCFSVAVSRPIRNTSCHSEQTVLTAGTLFSDQWPVTFLWWVFKQFILTTQKVKDLLGVQLDCWRFPTSDRQLVGFCVLETNPSLTDYSVF